RQAIAGTIVGNLMEWYDVGVYGYLAVLIGRVFLPEAAPSVKSLFSLGVFAVTFVARPLGGIILGQLGDRLGRHRVLALTLTMMSASTFLIGILPDYSVIGAWAPILLIVLKLAQGFSTGGEYAGAT
ncbi:MFS transporter, partial [Escherichia coli]